MALKKKKVSARRQQVRHSISADRLNNISRIVNSPLPMTLLVMLVFTALTITIISVDTTDGRFFRPDTPFFKTYQQVLAISAIVILTLTAATLYIHHYEPRILTKPTRLISLAGLFLVLLTITKISSLYPEWVYLATGSAVTSAIILTIAYNQRFALGITIFYAVLGCFAVGQVATVRMFELFLTMMAGIVTCSYSLKEIRTRMKLIEVAAMASVVVAIASASMGVLQRRPVTNISFSAGVAALVTFAVGIVIQGFLPIIEKVFGIATSMTLLDYSDANQPLLRKLAMQAPGTFSHSLLIGSIAEAAAEAIGANGLLCRVGAYYHDIGKINKPPYFVENEMGSASRHDQLSPAMSQLVIVGHVKDGIEIAKEYGLPAVLRQFIETHHGTTLIQYFYHEAKKKQGEKGTPVSESEFRYPGPKPQTREAAIVMLADTCESAARSLTEPTAPRIETLVHNMAMKRLQDGQFDECDLTLRELSRIEAALTKALAAHYHGRIAYPRQEQIKQAGEKSTAQAQEQTSEKN